MGKNRHDNARVTQRKDDMEQDSAAPEQNQHGVLLVLLHATAISLCHHSLSHLQPSIAWTPWRSIPLHLVLLYLIP